MGKCVKSSGAHLCCQEWGAEMRPWEDVYLWDGEGGEKLLCEDCFDGIVEELSRNERAQLMGARVMKAEEVGA